MQTKYIVNNVENQTITGNIKINGNLSVTGLTTGNMVTYKALLTQTFPFSSFSLNDLNGSFIVGETYTINTYYEGDDFSNIANVQSGIINEPECVFISTGKTPTNWSKGSQLTSSGNLVVDVIENNLGYDLYWDYGGMFGSGHYVAFPNTTGPLTNFYPRESVITKIQPTNPFHWEGDPLLTIYPSPASFFGVDDVIYFEVMDWNIPSTTDGALYYTPVEISIKQDMTPVIINGPTPSFPFNNVSIDLFCNGSNFETVYTNTDVNNITELIEFLNSDTDMNFFGVYSDNGLGEVILSMPTYLKNYYCPNGEITFQLFND